MKEWHKFAIVCFLFFIVGISLNIYSYFPNVKFMDRIIFQLFGIVVLVFDAIFTFFGIRRIKHGY
jgi:hypothetical protein